MEKGAQPAVLKGRAVPKTKQSLAARVANNSQKKIETLNRIDDVSLKSMHRFYDLEMIICESGYKKNSFLLKKQISSYQKALNEAKVQRQKTANRAFITQPAPSPDKPNRPGIEPALVPEPPPRPKYGVYLNCDPEAIGSVRRKTKTIQASSVSKSMTDLYRLRDKHISEYKLAVHELERLRSRLELPFTFDVACRSYTPVSATLPYSPIIVSLRKKIQYSENELSKLQKRLQELSQRYAPRAKTETTSVSDDEEEEEEEESKPKEPTFKIFCDKKDADLALGEKEQSTMSSRPITTGVPLLAKRRNSRRNSRAVKIDLEELKSKGGISLPMLNLFANSSTNSYIEMVDNPFDTGQVPKQTRSRLLIEAKNDDTMYKWLGFSSKAQLEKALKENPSSIKHIPAALLAMVEDGEEQTDLDKEEFSDTDSENDDDDDDARFKIFDKKKFKERRESLQVPRK